MYATRRKTMDAEHAPVMADELADIKERLAAALAAAADSQGAASVGAALAAYELARLDGLCHNGAWECALEAGFREAAFRRPRPQAHWCDPAVTPIPSA
jgi:hypothetical protein